MPSDDLGQELMAHLPYLRRHARALTGSQATGDSYAMATMEALIADPSGVESGSVRIDLFRAFHLIWASSGAPVGGADDGAAVLERGAQQRLGELTPKSREALLLNAVEGFTVDEIGRILGVSSDEAGILVDRAYAEMGEMVTGKVLVIEDEAVIAMDLEGIVSSMGHTVTGVARTADGAMSLAAGTVPDLILADIQLADGSTGIEAVNRLADTHGGRSVIFITAFPEKLLTGERLEPAFLITKPYSEEQVRAAVSQAMFFATTEGVVAAE